MHEVGHTLGPAPQLPRVDRLHAGAARRSASSRATHGIAGSVMEYNADQHRAARRDAGRVRHERRSGPTTTGRSSTAYKDDRAGAGGRRAASASPRAAASRCSPSPPTRTRAPAIDPEATQGDLGDDPLEFAARRLALARELWERWQNTPAQARRELRRCCAATSAAGSIAGRRVAASIAAKYIGGVTVAARSRRLPARRRCTRSRRSGSATRSTMLATGVFSSDSFRFKPEFMRRLQVDYLDRNDMLRRRPRPRRGVDYSLPTQVLAIAARRARTS